PTAPVPTIESQATIARAANPASRHRARLVIRVGIGTCLLVLGFIAAASAINPKTFLSTFGRSFEVAKHNLNQWARLISHEESVPEKAKAEVKVERKDERVTVPNGSSIYKIATDAYGTKSVLGMDLIKEFNPQIKNLNRIAAGKDLLLPRLTPETLLRKQSDGSYLLVVASFRSRTEANEYAARLSNKGYQVGITPRKVADDLLLHRVEINGLKTLEEANQIWQTGVRSESLAFAGNPDGSR
ncbi:MAG TPA: SPOR domain-containing protein, partial [Candidatus Binatia bacterium]|nr:SPOR domain-containing protein [Candidatus Binatia bacterium]